MFLSQQTVQNDTYGDEDETDGRRGAPYPSDAIGQDGLPLHHYPKDKGDRLFV
jgi:hypothetical protein